jgi:hypothetical protein
LALSSIHCLSQLSLTSDAVAFANGQDPVEIPSLLSLEIYQQDIYPSIIAFLATPALQKLIIQNARYNGLVIIVRSLREHHPSLKYPSLRSLTLDDGDYRTCNPLLLRDLISFLPTIAELHLKEGTPDGVLDLLPGDAKFDRTPLWPRLHTLTFEPSQHNTPTNRHISWTKLCSMIFYRITIKRPISHLKLPSLKDATEGQLEWLKARVKIERD